MLNQKGLLSSQGLQILLWFLVSGLTVCFAADKPALKLNTKNNHKAIVPISAVEISDKEKLALGQKLFFEKSFSFSETHACASCHDLNKGGADTLETFSGHNNRSGTINTPTIYNVRYNFRQFWDGRAKTLASVITDHIEDKHIFNQEWENIIQRLQKISDYSQAFSTLYTNGINQQNIEDALITYVNSLVTPNAPFDRYLQGEENAISAEAINGYQLFMDYGCISCHQGPNIGGNLYQKMGIYEDYFESKRIINETDLGRYNITNREEDVLVFKVPSLRNIALTGPYLHDGSAKTLTDAIHKMAVYQVGQQIPNHEVSDIIAFLNTLTGDQPKTPLQSSQE